jgi:hypothetical protein
MFQEYLVVLNLEQIWLEIIFRKRKKKTSWAKLARPIGAVLVDLTAPAARTLVIR